MKPYVSPEVIWIAMEAYEKVATDFLSIPSDDEDEYEE